MSKNKTTNCKTCNTKIAKNTKTYPSCKAKVKKNHPILAGIIAGIITFLVLIAIFGFNEEYDEPKKIDNDTATKTETSTNITELYDISEYERPIDWEELEIELTPDSWNGKIEMKFSPDFLSGKN